MKKIKVLVVDDHDIVIIGLRSILSRNHDIEIVATASSGEETISKVEEFLPDVVILDIDLPNISGIKVTEHITKNFPNTKVLLHTSFDDEENILHGFEAGASGYVPKTFKPDQLVDAIKTVYNGDKYIKGSVSDIFIESYFKTKKNEDLSDSVKKSLTVREVEVLKLISEGFSNKIIADKLNLSSRTIEAHKNNIKKKLEIYNTADLIKYSIKNRLIEL